MIKKFFIDIVFGIIAIVFLSGISHLIFLEIKNERSRLADRINVETITMQCHLLDIFSAHLQEPDLKLPDDSVAASIDCSFASKVAQVTEGGLMATRCYNVFVVRDAGVTVNDTKRIFGQTSYDVYYPICQKLVGFWIPEAKDIMK